MFTINQGCGFQLTFGNGIVVSVQFGGGHYCENRDQPSAYRLTDRQKERWTCTDAEVAVFDDRTGRWRTREVFKQLGLDDPCDDVAGYVSADDVAKIITACAALPTVQGEDEEATP